MTDTELEAIRKRYDPTNNNHRDVGKCTLLDFKALLAYIDRLHTEYVCPVCGVTKQKSEAGDADIELIALRKERDELSAEVERLKETFEQCSFCETWKTISSENQERFNALTVRAEKAEAELKALKDADRWISVDERLPSHAPYGEPIEYNVKIKGAIRATTLCYSKQNGWYEWDGDGVRHKYVVTHWRPLPPNDKEGER